MTGFAAAELPSTSLADPVAALAPRFLEAVGRTLRVSRVYVFRKGVGPEPGDPWPERLLEWGGATTGPVPTSGEPAAPDDPGALFPLFCRVAEGR